MKKVTSSQSEEEAVDKMIASSKSNHDTTDTMKPAAMDLEVEGDKLLTPKKHLIDDSSMLWSVMSCQSCGINYKNQGDKCQKILLCYKRVCD